MVEGRFEEWGCWFGWDYCVTMDVYSHVLPIMHENAMSELDQAFARLSEDEKFGDSGDEDGLL